MCAPNFIYPIQQLSGGMDFTNLQGFLESSYISHLWFNFVILLLAKSTNQPFGILIYLSKP